MNTVEEVPLKEIEVTFEYIAPPPPEILVLLLNTAEALSSNLNLDLYTYIAPPEGALLLINTVEEFPLNAT